MDPVALILTALTADLPDRPGPAAEKIRAGRDELRDEIARRLTGWLPADLALIDQLIDKLIDTGDVAGGRAGLARALLESRAADDPDLVQTATRVMRALDEAGYREGRYVVDLRGFHGLDSVIDLSR